MEFTGGCNPERRRSGAGGMKPLSSLKRLESEAIQIIRDGVAEAERPVLLFSGGKDSTVSLHIFDQVLGLEFLLYLLCSVVVFHILRSYFLLYLPL